MIGQLLCAGNGLAERAQATLERVLASGAVLSFAPSDRTKQRIPRNGVTRHVNGAEAKARARSAQGAVDRLAC